MSAVTISQMSERVAALLEQRLGVRGRTLADKHRKAGRRLPRRVREAVSVLAEAEAMAQNPKLLIRVDEATVTVAYDLAVRHLNGVKRGEQRMNILVGMAASAAFGLLVVAVLVIGVLYWRGMI